LNDDNIEIFKIWAPDNVYWSQWAKPVLFANMRGRRYGNNTLPELEWITQADNKMAVIVDLPGYTGVLEGLALAQLGYRPVPLYNGVSTPSGAPMVVPVDDIIATLNVGANDLSSMVIKPDAPPAFLLDSYRMNDRSKEPGTFDNRWCIFPQDMPSASALLSNGIDRVVVRSYAINDDLEHILYRYESQGITVYKCVGKNIIREKIRRPSRYRGLFYRFGVILGLKRNATGGFGGMIPYPSQSSGRYHGYG